MKYDYEEIYTNSNCYFVIKSPCLSRDAIITVVIDAIKTSADYDVTSVTTNISFAATVIVPYVVTVSSFLTVYFYNKKIMTKISVNTMATTVATTTTLLCYFIFVLAIQQFLIPESLSLYKFQALWARQMLDGQFFFFCNNVPVGVLWQRMMS